MSWILKNNGKILEDICLDPQTVEVRVGFHKFNVRVFPLVHPFFTPVISTVISISP